MAISPTPRSQSRSPSPTVAALVLVSLLAWLGACAGGSAATKQADRPAPNPQALMLPEPTGDFQIGSTSLHLVDKARTDAGEPRELMIQLWYPARPAADDEWVPYAPSGEQDAMQQFYSLPEGAFDTPTHARVDAPAHDAQHHPVVFFYHGLCASRTDSTIVAEELASHGYVVVTLASTGESAAVQFPDGRVVTPSDPAACQAGGDPFSEAGQQALNELLETRVGDVRFVADQLEQIQAGKNPDIDGKKLPTKLHKAMELSKLGIYGHSFGGGTAAAVLAEDERFVAGMNLDGFVIGPVATAGIDKPFLTVGSSYHDPVFDPSWATFLPKLAEWHRWYQVKTAGHYRFIDLGGSAQRWKLADTIKAQDPATWDSTFGDLDDATSQEINRYVVRGFFDKELLGEDTLNIEDPNARFPELVDRTADIPK